MKALVTKKIYLGPNPNTGGTLEMRFIEGAEIDRSIVEKYQVQLEANGIIRPVETKEKRPKSSNTREK